MHQQIKASPDDTSENVARILAALAADDINILALAPDFDPPHVRVVVDHEDIDRAMKAMARAGLRPQKKSAFLLAIKDTPGQLKAAMDAIAGQELTVESVLVLPGLDDDGNARVSFGIRHSGIPGWTDEQADNLATEIGNEIN